jgi:hypothetical protein
MKAYKKITVSILVFLMLTLCFISVYDPHVLPLVHAQGSGIQYVQGPIQPTQITSTLSGYPIEFNATYQAYLKNNSDSKDSVNFFSNGYNFTNDISTSQVNGYNSTIATLDVVPLSGTAMNPLATTASVSGTTVTYNNAYPLSTNLTYSAAISELDEVLAIGQKPSFSAPADYLQFEENCYYNSSLAIYANGVEYLNPSGAQFTTNGSINFNQVSGNYTEFCLPAPYVSDSEGNMTLGNYGVLANNGILTVYIRVPVSFLDGSILYPVFVDPTLVQGNGSTNGHGTWSSGTTFGVTMGSSPSSGDVMILTFGSEYFGSSYVTVSSISESGVTWASEGNPQAQEEYDPNLNHVDSEVWIGIVGSSASTSITVTISSSTVNNVVANAVEWSGVATSSFFDKNSAAGQASGTSCATGTTATTSQASELWIGSVSAGDVGSALTQSTPTNSFTLLDGSSVGTSDYVSNAYLYYIASSTGTASSGTTFGTTATGAGCIATFKASGGTTYSMTVTSSPNTGTGYITVGGVAETTPYTVTGITSGTQYTIAANSYEYGGSGSSSQFSTSDNTEYAYSSWSDSGAQSHTVTITSTVTFTATFVAQYAISIATARIGSDTSGTVATLQGTNNPESSLPYAVWVNSGASCTYSFSSPISGTHDVYTWASTSGLSQTTQTSSGFTVSTYGTLTGTYQIAYTETASQATAPLLSNSRSQTLTRTSNSKLNNALPSNTRTYAGTRTSTSLLNSFLGAVTRAFVGTRTTNSLLNNLLPSASRSSTLHRSTSSLLSTSLISLTHNLAFQRANIALLSNILTLISRSFTGSRSIASLPNNLLGSISRGFAGTRTTNSLLGNLATSNSRNTALTRTTSNIFLNTLISLTKTYGANKASTTLLGQLLLGTSRATTTQRATASLFGNVLDTGNKNAALFRSSNSFLANIIDSVSGLSSHHVTVTVTSLLSQIIDTPSAFRVGSWVVYVGEMLGQLTTSVIGLKYVLANGSDLSDMTVAATIGAMFAGVTVFALFYARRKRNDNDADDQQVI